MFSKLTLITFAGLPLLAACGTTIQPGHLGIKNIVLDEPSLEEEVRPEGFYFQWAWNSMVSYDVTWQSKDERVEVLTKDDLHLPTTVTVTYRAAAKALHDLHTRLGPTYYEEIIRPAFMTIARREFAKHKHNDLARMSNDVEAKTLAALRKHLEGKPLEIDSISVKHIEYDRRVTESISQKLVKEQQAEQKEFELTIAKRDAEIARTTARGVADATRIRAEGEAQAIVLKGKAQAEAQEAIAKTLTKDYLQYKAFDGDNATYYFVPIGKDGLPLIINADGKHRRTGMAALR